MSVRNALVLFLALSTLSLLVACGSSSPTPQAPPGGGFSPSSLNGTYVFSSAGENADAAFMTITGSFTASNGGISGGTVDVISADPAYGLSPGLAMSNPSYIISADGRGQINFGVTVTGTNGPTSFTFDFVLASTSHGLITEFDANGSGSGTIDLQPSPVPQSALSNLSFSFGISGSGSTASFGTVGALTLGATGDVTAGVEDFNNGGTPATSAISTSSFVSVGTGTAPGTATLVSGFGSGAYSYDVYAIDSTHLKFIETDGQFIASGDAYTQGTSIPDGTYVFAMSGTDLGGDPLSVAGFMPVSGGAIAAGAEDFNDAGIIDATPVAFSGGFSALTGGRSQLSVATFVNGAANDVAGSYLFAAYPFSSNGVTGVQLMEIDGLVTSGVAYVQSSTTLAPSQGYGLNLSAVNVSNGAGGFYEEDDIAEFQATSTAFTPGIVDINDATVGTLYKQTFNGTYASVTGGEYTATTTEQGNAFVNFNFYAVNGSTFLLLETDAGQIGTGIFELQNASTSPGAEPGISMVRASSVSAHALRRK
jgi:hypothetical protein